MGESVGLDIDRLGRGCNLVNDEIRAVAAWRETDARAGSRRGCAAGHERNSQNERLTGAKSQRYFDLSMLRPSPERVDSSFIVGEFLR